LRLHDERHEKHENAIHAVDVADAEHVPDAEYARAYPPAVDAVAVAPENRLPALAVHAVHAATAIPISINVVAGHGDGLPFDDASFERLVARKPNTP
jgi:hypothetical protein